MIYRKLFRLVNRHLKKKDDRKLKSLLVRQDYPPIAKVIDNLEFGKVKVFGLLPPEIQAEVAPILATPSKDFIFPRMSDYSMARMLHFMDEDDAVDVLQHLTLLKQNQIIEKLKPTMRRKVEKLLKYHPETAGGIMDMNFMTVEPKDQLKDVALQLKGYSKKLNQTPLVVVVDSDTNLLGYIPHTTLISNPPSATTKSLLQPLPTIPYATDQEKVLEKLMKERSEVIGVVDRSDSIIGVVNARDIIRVVQEEATEDVFRFAGIQTDESTFGSITDSVNQRYRWLLINLGTALLASFVISFFESTIAAMAILAAYMPIVAGLGGNTGTQSLAVVVRGIALGEVTWSNSKRIVFKEMIIGLFNGLIVGSVAALVAMVLNTSPLLGLVLGISIIINLTIAGLVGGLTPLVLRRFGVDPAIASSVFVTAAVDIVGFAVFLGLAQAVLT